MTEKYIITFDASGIPTAKIEREFAPGVISLANFMAGDSARFLKDYILSTGEVSIKKNMTYKSDKEESWHVKELFAFVTDVGQKHSPNSNEPIISVLAKTNLQR